MSEKELKVSGPSLRITRYKMASFGVFTSATYLLIVATYPSFFLFNPAEQTDSLRLVILLLSTIAWISLAIGPAFIFSMVSLGRQNYIKALPFVALAWPAMILVNHIHLGLTTGETGMSYLINFPVFIITDILTPLLLTILWLEYRHEDHSVHHRLKRH